MAAEAEYGADLLALVDSVLSRIRAVSTEERRRVSKGYYPSALEVLGAANPEVKRIAGDVKRETKTWPASQVVELARALVATNTFEGRHAAYLLLTRHRQAFELLGAEDIEALGRGNDNWASVDGYACLLSGVAWQRGRLDDATIRRWAESEDRWWRRTALVSTVPLNATSKGRSGESERTLAICDLLRGDHDDMIVKAMSWALRKLSRVDRDAVAGYLERHAGELHARVKREVRNKLETGRKNK